MDKNLNLKEHSKSLKGKVASGLSALKKLKHIFHNLNYMRFIMHWLKVTSDTGMLSGAACQTRIYRRFSVYRIGHSPSLKVPNERTPGTVLG